MLLKNFRSTLISSVLLSATILPLSSFASSGISVTLGQDLVNSQLPVSIAYAYNIGTLLNNPHSFEWELDNIKQQRLLSTISTLNSDISGQTLDQYINHAVGPSRLSLGIYQNGQTVYPTGCKDISLVNLHSVNFSETGCAVS